MSPTRIEETMFRPVRKSCELCRRRKTKCSGGQPCENCKILGKECNYEPQEKAGPKAGTKTQNSSEKKKKRKLGSENNGTLEMEQELIAKEKKEFDSDLSSELIEINIGGQSILQAQYGTLCLFPNSAFGRMFRDKNESNHKKCGVSRDSKGRIFFDHDPSLIECIINYLRLKRIHTLATNSTSPPPPMPPPKPPNEKKEEFDILLHVFGLTRSFYPNTNNEGDSQKETMEIVHNQQADGKPRASNIPTAIIVSKEGKENEDEGNDCCDYFANSTDDSDDDDDAKTIPLSIASNDESEKVQEVNTKRARSFEGNNHPENKKMRRSNDRNNENGNENQNQSEVTAIERKVESFRGLRNLTGEKIVLEYLEALKNLDVSKLVRNDIRWNFRPGKPVDTCSHCPACGGVFPTKDDKLKAVHCKKHNETIKLHQRRNNCVIWTSQYQWRSDEDMFDDDAQYTFFCISRWNTVKDDCVRLIVKTFSREVAIQTMKNRFAVGRLHLKGHYFQWSQRCAGWRIKTRYRKSVTREIIDKSCFEILDEVSSRCMAILHHKNFPRVTSRKMVTQVINDLNLMTVSHEHAYRLIAEYEKQCGIGTEEHVVSHDYFPKRRQTHTGDNVMNQSQRYVSSHDVQNDGDGSPLRPKAVSLSNSSSDNEFPDSNIQRKLFLSQSQKSTPPRKRNITQIKSEELVFRSSSKESPGKSFHNTIDLLSSDSESEDAFVVTNTAAPKKTPLKVLQKIVDRYKSGG